MLSQLRLAVEQAAAAFGISRAFAFGAVRWGAISSIRIGCRVLVPQAAFVRMLGDKGKGGASDVVATTSTDIRTHVRELDGGATIGSRCRPIGHSLSKLAWMRTLDVSGARRGRGD